MSTRALLVTSVLALGCSDPFVPRVGPRIDAIDAGVAVDDAASDGVSFARDIRPLMNRSNTDPSGHGCKTCHYKDNPPAVGYLLARLDLTSLGTLRKGGNTSGANVVVPGKPEESAIVKKLRGTYSYGTRMPKDGADTSPPGFWTEEQIMLMETWIREGAKGADDE